MKGGDPGEEYKELQWQVTQDGGPECSQVMAIGNGIAQEQSQASQYLTDKAQA